MKELANADIRKAAKDAGVSLWEIADTLNISEPTVTRMLRHELSDDRKQELLRTIASIAEAKKRRSGCGNTLNG